MKKIYLLLVVFVSVGVNAQIINIPDVNFKNRLLASVPDSQPNYYLIAADINGEDMLVDANNDGEIEVDEALAVYRLKVQGSNNVNSPTDISDLTGIEYFKNLVELNCADNMLTTLDVSALTNLLYFRCDRNSLSNLNVSGLTKLITFYYGSNHLQNVDYTGMDLYELSCENNQITNLDVSNLPNLRVLFCGYNLLQDLDLRNLTGLRSLNCAQTQLTELDLSYTRSFIGLNANDNPFLKRINTKSGRVFESNDVANFRVENCPSLMYLCADEFNVALFRSRLPASCNINTYCSFVPGGSYYNMYGQVKLDAQSDGCDAEDSFYSSLKFSITNGVTSGFFVSDDTGNYQFPMQNGSHTIAPILENPDYFHIWPSSITVNLPADANQMLQNFCLTPKTPHQDLEIIIIPATIARPGFDVSYKIIYKNKGNTTVSGDIRFEFLDSMMDFIGSVPQADSQTLNRLRYNYFDLLPFEKREILVSFNLNSPMETPAVIDGTILSFTAAIFPVLNDVYVPDNNFSLKHTVVNSFDPNDKTCLEGTTITPDMAGKYVHYKIRFENTGSANAENIVVKDMIDTTKFDISSLIPINASHSFVTKISDTNKVEFIFQNINLPFDDANNDGYVVFKIKTKPTLVLGDSFSNSASIYFDYNFPIITNTETTTLAVLETKDFEFSDYFSLYPNPANQILNIESKKRNKISSVSIYNTLGQLVLVVTDVNQSIDVSGLKSGNYFIKVNSDKGNSNIKFIKN